MSGKEMKCQFRLHQLFYLTQNACFQYYLKKTNITNFWTVCNTKPYNISALISHRNTAFDNIMAEGESVHYLLVSLCWLLNPGLVCEAFNPLPHNDAF